MKFRKKPVVIDTVQYNGENEEEIFAAFGREFFNVLADAESFMLVFKTAHGDDAYARPGDWVAPDILPGTFYPIKDEVVKNAYEVFNYDEELTEDSSLDEVLAKIRSSMMATLPMQQINIAMGKIDEAFTGTPESLAKTAQSVGKAVGRG